MEDIKIFVSHRIDIKSLLIDNPIYQHVRCGAVFDNANPMKILGDDTGENISDKRLSFCEFTVQYWAWKNVEANYYGMCHYRRYLSFSDKTFKTNEMNKVVRLILLPYWARQFSLDRPDEMIKKIMPFDIVSSEPANVLQMYTPCGHKDTVKKLWLAHAGLYFEDFVIDLLFELIDELHPTYSQSAREYFEGDKHRGFNCFVVKKDLFFRMCEFQFDIMFEAEKRLDTTDYTTTMKRTPAFMGEMLYGVFVYHVTRYENADLNELQLVFFSDADDSKSKLRKFVDYMRYASVHVAGKMLLPLFPRYSKRRESIKRFIYLTLRIKNRGAAEEIKNTVNARVNE